ncbi:hypothetical protein F887_01862 [Acinetobacter sp. NIPH 2100]|nr:hypothetical protein F887_01862 [Acinetobacter sp. NIPH 2100]
MFLKKFLGICVLSSMFAISGCQKNDQQAKENVEDITQSGLKLDATQMMAHLQAFEQIAKRHGGNRAVGTQGGLASADYIFKSSQASRF